MDSLPCIIPARGGSRGIPRKNIVELAGKPLIAWAIAAAQGAAAVGAVHVSTEDAEIAAVARRHGAAVIDRPPALAADDTTSEAVLIHALDRLRDASGALPEAFVFVQCTSPLLTAADIDAAVALLDREAADSVVPVTGGCNFLWRREAGGSAGAVNHDPRVRLPRQLAEAHYRENGAVYVARSEAFLREGTRYCGRVVLHEMSAIRSVEIDEPEDLRLVAAIMAAGLHRPA